MTENNNVFWFDLFERYQERIENIHDLLDSPVQNLEDDITEDESENNEDLNGSEYEGEI